MVVVSDLTMGSGHAKLANLFFFSFSPFCTIRTQVLVLLLVPSC